MSKFFKKFSKENYVSYFCAIKIDFFMEYQISLYDSDRNLIDQASFNNSKDSLNAIIYLYDKEHNLVAQVAFNKSVVSIKTIESFVDKFGSSYIIQVCIDD